MNMSDKRVFKNVSGFYSSSSSYQKFDKTRHHLIIQYLLFSGMGRRRKYLQYILGSCTKKH